MGHQTNATGDAATAMGNHTTASGFSSTALGIETIASGYTSTATGDSTVAELKISAAMGFQSQATGDYSIAMGNNVLASGENSLATGFFTTASGANSIAMGSAATASGDKSTALGNYASTDSKVGSFDIGDFSTVNVLRNTVANQMVMRFVNGYQLYTNNDATVGVQVVLGGNAWSTISDKYKKEKIEKVNGEDFLQRIAAFDLGSWNYKGQDSKTLRHYGPMAQGFYTAFGKDNYGTIGNDTTINQADFDGVNLIAIQALEKRTAGLNVENEKIKMQNASQAERLEELENKVSIMQKKMDEQNDTLTKQLQELKQLIEAGILQSPPANNE